MFSEQLIHWSARLAVACYVARLIVDVSDSADSVRFERRRRWIWTGGLTLYLIHVIAAFHFAHDWSHSRAWDHTAEQTAAIVGLKWGGGVYVNYVFTLVWLADVVRMWGRVSLPGWAGRALHGVFAVLMFNATVVFGSRYWMGVCMATIVVLICLKTRPRRV